MRVLVVDDSVVFRSQIKSALSGSDLIEVVGVANNGKIALQKLSQLSVDLVTLDMEMPEMSGLETIREIRKAKFKVRIIVFSSYTTRGSEMALDALAAGADDFIAKPSGPGVSIENSVEKIREELLPKVMQFRNREDLPKAQPTSPTVSAPIRPSGTAEAITKRDLNTFFPSVIVVGSSTGGPPALEKILENIKGPIRVPILIAQHMPPMFTASLAKRLESLTGVPAAEGKHLEELKPNRIYVAPGDHHMTLIKRNDTVFVNLDQSPQRNSVRPAVDPLFETATKVFGTRVMSFVLTGMGEDGLVGAKVIKAAGGGLMIQDRSSCVVFGMPGAIFATSIFDQIGSLEEINSLIRRMTA